MQTTLLETCNALLAKLYRQLRHALSLYIYLYININCSSILPFLRRNKHPSGSWSFAIQMMIKAETHTSFSFGHPAQFQLTFSSMSTGTIPKKGLIAIAGTISAFSSEGRGAMQMPPVSGRKLKNKIYVVHPLLGESKFQLLGEEENNEATLQESATRKKNRHLKAAQAWHRQYSASHFLPGSDFTGKA